MLKNSLQNFFEKKNQEHIVQRAKERFAYKPFYVEYKSLYQVASSGRFLFHAFSIATGLTFLAILLNQMVQVWIVSLLVSGLLLLVWEKGKNNLLAITFTRFYRSGRAAVDMFVIALIFLSVSVFVSVRGAKEFYQIQDVSIQQFEAKQDSQKDSVNLTYQNQIEVIQGKIAAIEVHKPKRWGGLLSQSENKQILNYQNEIELLHSNKRDELAELERVGDAEKTKINKAFHFNSTLFIGLALFNEAMILLIAWFLVFYDYKTAIESEALTHSESFSFDLATIQKLIELVQVNAATKENPLLITDAATKQTSIGFQSASVASKKPNELGKNSENAATDLMNDSTTDLATDIKNGIRDYRYLMKKHKVNVVTVSQMIKEVEN